MLLLLEVFAIFSIVVILRIQVYKKAPFANKRTCHGVTLKTVAEDDPCPQSDQYCSFCRRPRPTLQLLRDGLILETRQRETKQPKWPRTEGPRDTGLSVVKSENPGPIEMDWSPYLHCTSRPRSWAGHLQIRPTLETVHLNILNILKPGDLVMSVDSAPSRQPVSSESPLFSVGTTGQSLPWINSTIISAAEL